MLYAQNAPGPWDQNSTENNITQPIGGVLGNEIDLREEFASMIENHGHPIILRQVTSIRCPLYQENYKEDHTSNCPYCMGTGFKYKDIKLKAYNRVSGTVESHLGQQRQDIGYLSHNVQIYYLPAEMPSNGQTAVLTPTVADFILEVDLTHDDPTIIKAPRIRIVFNIQIVHALRDKKGRVEYYMCKCTERPTGY